MLEGVYRPLMRKSFLYNKTNFFPLNHVHKALFSRDDPIRMTHQVGTKPKTNQRFVRSKNFVVVKIYDIAACDPVDYEASKVSQRLSIGTG